MVAFFHQVSHKKAMSQEQQDRQGRCVQDECYCRLESREAEKGCFLRIGYAPQQSSLQEEASLHALRREDLMDAGFVAPDKEMSFFDHSSKEVDILAPCPAEKTIEGASAIKNPPVQEDIAGSRISRLSDDSAGSEGLSFGEPALHEPRRGFCLKIGLDRTQDPVGAELTKCLVQVQKPDSHSGIHRRRSKRHNHRWHFQWPCSSQARCSVPALHDS